ncbi:MAG: signal peptidase II [Xanthomonadales bacterium]|nr:signal peptidase II [Xanthomonadales bacterium]
MLLSAVVIVLDQLTKWIAVTQMNLYESIPVMWGLNWTLLHNYGAAFSFLSDHSGWQRWFFTIIAIVVTAVLAVWLKRTPRSDWTTAAPLSLIIGGAVGNLIDRLRLGYVVDFIDVYYQQWHWPAFNIADSAISIGAISLILISFLSENQGDKQESRKTGNSER